MDREPGVPTATTVAPSPAATVDPRALPAVKAYEAFAAAAYNAERKPFGLDPAIPPSADFTKHTFDPFRTKYRAYILGLANQGGEYRGTPPTLNVIVKSINLNAKPWPTVTLSDCPTGGNRWRLYSAKTGKVQPQTRQKVAPPYRSTVTMIFYQKHWGIQEVALDSSRTCTPAAAAEPSETHDRRKVRLGSGHDQARRSPQTTVQEGRANSTTPV